MTKNNPVKNKELAEIQTAYGELKGMWDKIMAQKKLEAEEEMERAREEFSALVQSKVDRVGYPYKITVADLARAMNTTNRGTVYKYLKDARERAKGRYFETLNPTLPYELYGVWSSTQGNPAFTTTWAIVFDGENTWDVTFDEARYSVFVAVPDETKPEGYGRTGPEKKFSKALDNDAPEWLTWLVQQDEWKEKVVND